MEYIRVNELEILLRNREIIQNVIEILKLQIEALNSESDEAVIQSMIFNRKLDGLPAAKGNSNDITSRTALGYKCNFGLREEGREICRDLILLDTTLKKIDIGLNALQPLERSIMELKYFKILTWQQISDKILFSDGHARRKMRQAMLKLTSISKITIDDYNRIQKLLS